MDARVQLPMSIRDIFLHAVQIANPQERRAYLEEVCGGNASRLQAVEKMVAADASKSAAPFDRLVKRLTPSTASPLDVTKDREGVASEAGFDFDVADHPEIGPYKLLEPIGEGGMGVVYLAQQSQPVRRMVALKVIKPGMDSRQVIARFEAERQALAMMDHPNIARVLDAGTTDQGHPYFVMELVRGIPITEYCDRVKMPVRQRLELFCEASAAVQHAHNKGIIHRDIKPSNVLVTENDGTPMVKVIDFGVAKALTDNLTDKTIFTGVFQMIGTPLYMSPEQASLSNFDVDTRSDVYSLGVMLYELLTGVLPMDRESIKDLSYEELRRHIETSEPLRPSRRMSTLKEELETIAERRSLDARQIQRDASSELDWIVMKAIEKDRSRRYQSPREFAEDIQNYLDGKAVEACPPSVSYRLRKYANRHRGLLTSLTLIAATLLVATGVSLTYAIEANIARDEADIERVSAVQARKESEAHFAAALDAIDKLLEHASASELAEIPKAQAVRQKILQDVLTFYGRFDISTENASNVQYRAVQTWLQLSRLNGEIGDLEQGKDTFEITLEKSRQLVNEFPGSDEYQMLLAGSLRWAAHFHLFKAKNPDVALPYLREEKALIDQRLQRDPGNQPWLRVKVTWLNLMGSYDAQAGDVESQLQHQLAAYQILKTLPPDSVSSSFVNTARHLANTLKETDPEQANRYFRESIEFSRSWADVSESRMLASNRVLILHSAFDFYYQQDPELALDLLTEAIRLSNQLVAEYPSISDYQLHVEGNSWRVDKLFESLRPEELADGDQSDFGQKLHELIDVSEKGTSGRVGRIELFMALGRHEEALDGFESALELAEKDSKKEFLHKRRGDFYFSTLHDYQSALSDFDQAITVKSGTASADDLWYLHKRRGWAHFRLGHYDDALADLKAAAEARPDDGSLFSGVDPKIVASCEDDAFRSGLLGVVSRTIKQHDTHRGRYLKGMLLFADGRDDEALVDFSKAVELQKLKPGSEPYFVQRGYVLANIGQFALAEKDFVRASELNPDGWSARYWRALIALSQGRFDHYQTLCQQMVDQFESSEEELGQLFTTWTCALGPDALTNYQPAIDLARQHVAPDEKDVQKLQFLGAIYVRAKRFEEAKAALGKVVAGDGTARVSPAYSLYLLAMTEHELGNDAVATKQLQAANEFADKELSESSVWNRETTLKLLRDEAESLIEPSIERRETVENE